MSKKGQRFFVSSGLVALGLLAGIMISQVGAAAAGTRQQVHSAANRDSVALDEFIPQGAFVRVAETTQPALVFIETEQTVRGTALLGDVPEFFRRFYGDDQPAPEDQVQAAQGSGFLISPDGFIITNAHVVSQTDLKAAEIIEADKIMARLANDDEYEATVVGIDIGTDLAVLKIDAGNDLPFLPLGDSNQSRVGEWVMALGAPFGLTNTVSAGIISAKGRAPFRGVGSAYQDFIQTDAQINPGNSGGPLINLRGEVIGINTAIVSNGFQAQWAGVGFAIPITMASGVIDQLIEHGHTIRGWLGVSISVGGLTADLATGYGLDPHEVRGAVLISRVNPGEPADAGGVRDGDIVVGTDGVPLQGDQDFLQRIALTPPHETISLQIIRPLPDDSPTGMRLEDLTLDVTLAERAPEIEVAASSSTTRFTLPDEPRRGRGSRTAIERQLGLSVEELSQQAAAELEYDPAGGGILVTSVRRNGAAQRAGLIAGAVIREVNERPVNSVQEFESRMAGFEPGSIALLVVWFPGGGSARVPLHMPDQR